MSSQSIIMLFTRLSLGLCAIAGASALPSSLRSTYAVKERHIVPRGWTERGPADKAETIHLQIGVKQQNEGVVEQHLIEVSDPKHARYGQHLTAAEINELVAPSEESVKLVQDWLAEHDIDKIAFSPAKDWIHVLIPVEKAERLLQTSYSVFEHEDGATLSRAPEWSLPVHLHEHIDVVQPTTSFFRAEPEANTVIGGETVSMTWWEQEGKFKYAENLDVSDQLNSIYLCELSFLTIAIGRCHRALCERCMQHL